jgi:ABC-type phosphate/phosphonate transport system substrate-binding protein
MLRYNRVWSLTLVILLLAAAPSHDARAEAPLLLGVAPFMTPAALFKRLTPLRGYLSKELGREVVIELVRDIPQLLDRIDRVRYDLILGGAVFALRAFDGGHYLDFGHFQVWMKG